MNWFRWYTGTATDPKFMVVARLAGQNVAAVVAVWAMLLERASDVSERDETQCNAEKRYMKRGFVSGFDCEAADAVLGLEDGASEAIMRAMEKKGLLTGERVTNWEKRQPKREDNSTERVRRFREKKKAETQCNAGKREETLEESRVDNININTLTTFECLSPKVGDVPSRPEEYEPEKQEEPEEITAKRPPCPAKEIVELYHEILPEHPRVEILNETRRRSINARWSDIGTRLKEKGREDTRAARLAYMRQIFLKASQSDFLCGRTTCRDGKTYMVTFDKLMSPSGFIGVIEGKYDNRG